VNYALFNITGLDEGRDVKGDRSRKNESETETLREREGRERREEERKEKKEISVDLVRGISRFVLYV